MALSGRDTMRRERLLREASVLFIDDAPDTVEGFKNALEQKGVKVTVATTAGQARSKLEAEAPDLVVLDVRLEDRPEDRTGLDLVDEFAKDYTVALISGYLERINVDLSEMNDLRTRLRLVLDKRNVEKTIASIQETLADLLSDQKTSQRRRSLGAAAATLTACALAACVTSSLAPTLGSLVALAVLASSGFVLTASWLRFARLDGSKQLARTGR